MFVQQKNQIPNDDDCQANLSDDDDDGTIFNQNK